MKPQRHGVTIRSVMLGISALGVCFLLIRGVYVSDQAERNYLAVDAAAIVLERFVQETGRWPAGWHDLKQSVLPNRDSPTYPWPDSAEELESRVVIDFDGSLESIDVSAPWRVFAVRSRTRTCYPTEGSANRIRRVILEARSRDSGTHP